MILPEVAIAACLMLTSVPNAKKNCEDVIKKECFTKNLRSYKTCYEKVAPEINAVAKEEYASMGKACTLN